MQNNDFISAAKDIKKNIVGGKEVLGGLSTPEIPEGPKRLGTILNAGIEYLEKNVVKPIKKQFQKANKSAGEFLGGYKDKDLSKEQQDTKKWTDEVERQRKANLEK